MISLWIVSRRVESINRDIRTSSTSRASNSSIPSRPASPTPSLAYPPSPHHTYSTVDEEWQRQVEAEDTLFPQFRLQIANWANEVEQFPVSDTEDPSSFASTPREFIPALPDLPEDINVFPPQQEQEIRDDVFLRNTAREALLIEPPVFQQAPDEVPEHLVELAQQAFPFVDEDFFRRTPSPSTDAESSSS